MFSVALTKSTKIHFFCSAWAMLERTFGTLDHQTFWTGWWLGAIVKVAVHWDTFHFVFWLFCISRPFFLASWSQLFVARQFWSGALPWFLAVSESVTLSTWPMTIFPVLVVRFRPFCAKQQNDQISLHELTNQTVSFWCGQAQSNLPAHLSFDSPFQMLLFALSHISCGCFACFAKPPNPQFCCCPTSSQNVKNGISIKWLHSLHLSCEGNPVHCCLCLLEQS